MLKVNSSGKILLVLFNFIFDFETAAYRLCAAGFFAVWLVIMTWIIKLLASEKQMVSVVKLVNRDFAFFCLGIPLNTMKFE